MKLDNFDFRIWNEEKKTYEDSDSIVKVFQDKLKAKGEPGTWKCGNIHSV